MNETIVRKQQGFAAISPERRREIAAKSVEARRQRHLANAVSATGIARGEAERQAHADACVAFLETQRWTKTIIKSPMTGRLCIVHAAKCPMCLRLLYLEYLADLLPASQFTPCRHAPELRQRMAQEITRQSREAACR